MHDGFGAFILMVLFAFYCIPMCIAMFRNHQQMLAIIILNFFFGWTLLGWAVALVWSCTNPAQPMVTTTP